MNNPSRLMIIVLFVIMSLSLLSSAYNYLVIGDFTEIARNQRLEAYYNQLRDEITLVAENAKSKAALVASIPKVQEAFAKGNRKVISDMFVSGFENIEDKYNFRQFQFHYPPATSFLRVHKPDTYGDDLSAFRNTVLDTNKHLRPISGLERGRAGIGIRGMVPVFYEDDHIGSVEFGLAFDQAFFESFKRRTGIEAAFHMLPNENIKTFKEKDAAFHQLASTFPKGLRIDPSYIKIGLNQPSVLDEISFFGRSHTLFTGPIKDFRGETAGVIIFAMDTSEYVRMGNTARNIILLQVIITLMIALMTFAFAPLGRLRNK